MSKLILLIGAPGSGKSSRAKECCEKNNLITHLSTSEKLKELGYDLTNPKSIPPSATIDLIKEAMQNFETVIVDGFPRVLKQAVALDEEFKVDKIIYLRISKAEARKRVLDRIVCPKCNRSYTENGDYRKPKVQGVCDNCNEALIKRSSDSAEVFDKRFENFCNYTYPVREYYQKKGVKVVSIDATSDVDICELI